jgi:hypothetical protein
MFASTKHMGAASALCSSRSSKLGTNCQLYSMRLHALPSTNNGSNSNSDNGTGTSTTAPPLTSATLRSAYEMAGSVDGGEDNPHVAALVGNGASRSSASGPTAAAAATASSSQVSIPRHWEEQLAKAAVGKRRVMKQ